MQDTRQLSRGATVGVWGWSPPKFKNGMILMALGKFCLVLMGCMSGSWRKVHEFHGRLISDHAILLGKKNSPPPPIHTAKLHPCNYCIFSIPEQKFTFSMITYTVMVFLSVSSWILISTFSNRESDKIASASSASSLVALIYIALTFQTLRCLDTVTFCDIKLYLLQMT